MGARSRRKGSRVERDVARLLQQALGGRWSRVPLSGGWGNRAEFATCGDVITTIADFPFTVECKAVEGWHLEQLLTSPDKCPIVAWWRQAVAEAREAGRRPLLVFTRNFQPIFAVLRAGDAEALDLAVGARGLTVRVGDDAVIVVLFGDLLPALKARFAPSARNPIAAAE